LWLIPADTIAQSADVPEIAAAADLKYALSEIAAAFAKRTGRQVKLTFGSSGNFTTRIEQGASFEMFLSADEGYVQRLDTEGKTEGSGAVYAIGRIGIFAPKGSVLTPDSKLADLAAALADGRLRKFAIANPEYAPYGRAAQEALEHAGLWEKIKDKLVLGENISQATELATSESAQGGIIAWSLEKSPEVAALGNFALIPADWHHALRQRMVLLQGAGSTARIFYEYMRHAAAGAVLKQYGFALPGETG
jgi:molybdate transport system substrate-binding protein